jgi:tetratricopeptide (TPR) repeat protein
MEGLKDREIAITGRLASLTRGEAVERIRAAGGRVVEVPTPSTAFLVVGRDGLPIEEDGGLHRKFRRARDLAAEGHPIRFVGEDELLEMLGLSERREGERLYTTAQLARILGVPGQRIRAWVRRGLVKPRRTEKRLALFDFRQVASARALSELAREGWRLDQVRDSLQQLARWMPDGGDALAQLEALEARGPLVVRDADGRLAETSGQLRMEFASAPTGGTGTRPLAPDWFEAGVDAEEDGRFADAVEAYEQALAEAPDRVEVCFNLGNALYALDRKAAAAHRYWQAVERDPEYVEAWNNLGNALSDLGEVGEAVEAFGHALAAAPGYGDAHFNLAETLASSGDLDGAREHWEAYLAIDPASTWAEEVRLRLRRAAAGVSPPLPFEKA